MLRHAFAIRDYGCAIRRRRMMDRATTNTKFWGTTVDSRVDGYDSGDDESRIGR